MHLAILRSGFLLAIPVLGAPEATAQTEFPHAAGTDRAGRAHAVSDAAGRVLIESPEFPRGVWVHLADEAGQALAGIQVEFQGRADSLVAIWSVDPSGVRQETVLWTRPGADTLRLALQDADPAGLTPELTAIDWRIDPGAEELLDRVEGPELVGWEAATVFLQERWRGSSGRVVVQVDSGTALAVDLAHPEAVARLVDRLQGQVQSALGDAGPFVGQVLLSPYAFGGDLALPGDLILLTTSFVLIPGSELEGWVLKGLRRSSGPVTWSEASALKELNLGRQKIVDVSPLAALTGLERLILNDNEISDVSSLARLAGLRVLELNKNRIVDVSPLSGLTRLTELRLGANQVVDVSPLSGLANLEQLDLWHNEIIDVTSLGVLSSLRSLHLGYNEIVDPSPLAALTNLENLAIWHNEIADAGPLAALNNLTFLGLSGNPVVDVSALSALTNLTDLDLVRNEIVDVSPLATLTGLRTLFLTDNEIVDVSPLASLTGLEELGLSRNRIVDVSPLASLTGLLTLFLDYNEITDVSPLSSLTNLAWLWLRGNEIEDISPLVANTGLQKGDELDLRDNPLSGLAIKEQVRALRDRGVMVSW